MPEPLVSLITVHYDQPEATGELLESLRYVTYPNLEIFVVDNGSPRYGVESLIPDFPEVTFLKSPVNLGFAGGNNLAMKQTRGAYLLFLNNDTEVEPGFLEPLVEWLETKPHAGLASPKIRYFHGDRRIQYAGATEINPYTGQNRFFGTGQPDDGRFDQSGPTPYVHGAAMLVSREVLKKTGPMDERFFLYYEELDWCARARRDGFTAWYVAESVVFHKESLSTGRQSPLKLYYLTRNRLLFMRRNVPPGPRLVFLAFFSLLATPKHTLRLLLGCRYADLRAYWRGIGWNLAHGAG